MDTTGLTFPFRIDDRGRFAADAGDAHLRARVVEVLLTSPGERVMNPEFGCGVRDLVFGPGDEVLEATAEFAVGGALQRWLGDVIVVERVSVSRDEGTLAIEVAYARRDRMERGQVRIVF